MKKIILLFFVFSITLNLSAQKKINLSELNIDQLNLYKEQAIKMRNTGIILTLGGIFIMATGYITTIIWSENSSLEGWDAFRTLIPAELGFLVGIPSAIVGTSEWIIGGKRKSKAEIALKKFDIKPENSMAFGMGVTLRF